MICWWASTFRESRMRTCRLAFFAAAFFIAAQMLLAAEANPAKQDRLGERSAIYHPQPEYPNDARRQRLEGDGLFRLDIEAGTGKVTNVKVIKSTGHKVLDKAGMQAFYRWQFPHGPATSIQVPLQFKLEEASAEEAPANVIYSPSPEYPTAALQSQLTFAKAHRPMSGSGLFALIVDRETGKVTEVKTMQSTGQKILDDAAISAFRRWRFKPKTVFRAVRVPITFVLGQQFFRYH